MNPAAPEGCKRVNQLPRIAVIGCGIAGVAAARSLCDQGHQVVCFDKSRGVGGRMSLRRQDRFEFDHGAQYFTAKSEIFKGQIGSWIQAGVIAEWNGRFVTLENGGQSSRPPQRRYVGIPGMTALVKHLIAGLTVQLSTPIASIQRLADGWKLVGDDGSDLGRFDKIILSIPAVQARTLLRNELPLLNRIAEAEMQPCWAVMAGFDRPVAADFDGAFVHGSPLSWMARNNSKPGRSAAEAWVLHASPEWSMAHLEEEPSAISQMLMAEFDRLTGCSIKPVHLQAHRWRFAKATKWLEMGSSNSGAVIDRQLGIAICGDWCLGSRVEDAYLSGVAAAREIV